jgi:Ser-tRNA(Ala) deacylase AlaX
MSVPPTDLLFYSDTFCCEADATVVALLPAGSAGGAPTLLLDRTVFYPAGGGQSADAGDIECVRTGARAAVSDARLRDGVVHHALACDDTHATVTFAPGDTVKLRVDSKLRLLHARLHSAGHLLDVAVARCGYPPDVLKAGKGVHSPAEAYVEYTGKVPPEDQLPLLERVNVALAELIVHGGAVRAGVHSFSAAAALCGGELPAYWTPGSTPRVVEMAGAGCPCGGTHVADLRQVGAVKCTGIRVKKGVTRIMYVVDC